jgi:hypothetical protein
MDDGPIEGSITVSDGRTVAYADFGDPGDPEPTSVRWCHGLG